jgi:hypothetical protein
LLIYFAKYACPFIGLRVNFRFIRILNDDATRGIFWYGGILKKIRSTVESGTMNIIETIEVSELRLAPLKFSLVPVFVRGPKKGTSEGTRSFYGRAALQGLSI